MIHPTQLGRELRQRIREFVLLPRTGCIKEKELHVEQSKRENSYPNVLQ